MTSFHARLREVHVGESCIRATQTIRLTQARRTTWRWGWRHTPTAFRLSEFRVEPPRYPEDCYLSSETAMVADGRSTCLAESYAGLTLLAIPRVLLEARDIARRFGTEGSVVRIHSPRPLSGRYGSRVNQAQVRRSDPHDVLTSTCNNTQLENNQVAALAYDRTLKSELCNLTCSGRIPTPTRRAGIRRSTGNRWSRRIATGGLTAPRCSSAVLRNRS
jgi:hypothetical protein